jgi:hypothetical protein
MRAVPVALSVGADMSKVSTDLKRIMPFDVQINVEFAPDTRLSGYRLRANGLATIGDKQVVICVAPQMRFIDAEKLNALRFDMTVDANAVVEHVNKTNKE